MASNVLTQMRRNFSDEASDGRKDDVMLILHGQKKTSSSQQQQPIGHSLSLLCQTVEDALRAPLE
jgi:hypothetical protein